ncbi:MAG TPA: fused MFS/spermidine synthase, partial [Micromonosporaceae bacterium]
PDPCDVETAYHCARIVGDPKRPGGRLLLLNSARHSYVDLADPRHLEFAYTQWIGAYVDTFAAAGRPVRALHLGGGGFTLPRYLSATRPGSVNRVLELDGGLVELNRSRLGMVPGPELRIAVGDARTLMAGEPAGDYDLVVGDAFGHLAVPWHLTTTEFVAGVRRVLRSGGSYVLNVIDYPPGRLIRAELATIRAVFSSVALVAPARAIAGEVGANFVIIASTAPLNLTGLAAGLARLPEPVRLLSDGPPASGGGVPATGGGAAGTGRHASELDAYVAGAGVLTDDYAPVDQLLSAP